MPSPARIVICILISIFTGTVYTEGMEFNYYGNPAVYRNRNGAHIEILHRDFTCMSEARFSGLSRLDLRTYHIGTRFSSYDLGFEINFDMFTGDDIEEEYNPTILLGANGFWMIGNEEYYFRWRFGTAGLLGRENLDGAWILGLDISFFPAKGLRLELGSECTWLRQNILRDAAYSLMTLICYWYPEPPEGEDDYLFGDSRSIGHLNRNYFSAGYTMGICELILGFEYLVHNPAHSPLVHSPGGFAAMRMWL